MRPRALVFLAAALLVSLTSVAPRPASAQCTYTPLVTGEPQIVPASPTRYSFQQMVRYWSVVGLRAPGADWDLGVFGATAPAPGCLASPLASSTYGTGVIDFVVGDFNVNALTTYYPYAYPYAGSATPTIQWEDGPDQIMVNGARVEEDWDTDKFIGAWDVYLDAGVTYSFEIDKSDYGSAPKMFLFTRGTAGSYWASRSGRLWEDTGNHVFTAATSGYYGLVVVNENLVRSHFWLSVSTCAPPVALAEGEIGSFTDRHSWWTVTPSSNAWTVFATWDTSRTYSGPALGGYTSPGGPPPECLGGFAGYGNGPEVVFFGGDYSAQPLQPFYTHVVREVSDDPKFASWQTAVPLAVGAAPVQAGLDPFHPYQVHQLDLVGGVAYQVHVREVAADPFWNQFSPRATVVGGGPWSTSQLSTTGCGEFTAPTTGRYAVVVSDEVLRESGTYELSVTQTPCECPVFLDRATPGPAPVPGETFRLRNFSSWYKWSAFAVAGAPGDDWDVQFGLAPGGSSPPQCLGNTLAGSTYGAGVIDFVLGYNIGTVNDDKYARAFLYSGSGAATARWEDQYYMEPNRGYTASSFESGHFIDVFAPEMAVGTEYRIEFNPMGPGVRLLVFEAPGAGAYATGRVGRRRELTGPADYTPTLSGEVAFVVVNDGGTDTGYDLRYGRCTPPMPLVAGIPDLVNGATYVSFAPSAPYWTAIGTRNPSSNWDIIVNASADGDVFPMCQSGTLAASTLAAPTTDFVVGDFNAGMNPPGTYYAMVNMASGVPPGYYAQGDVTWDAGTDVIHLNDPQPIQRQVGGNQVLEVWDVHLTAGLSYTLRFQPAGGANLHALLFRNKSGGVYWAGRAAAEFDVTADHAFTAPATGWYAVVVVNEDRSSGSFTLGVDYCPPPTVLANGLSQEAVEYSYPYIQPKTGFFQFTQSVPYYAAVGARGIDAVDWDVEVDALGTGGTAGQCFSDLRGATTADAPQVDFLVGDFNHAPYGAYFVRAVKRTTGSTARVEWDSGTDQIIPNGPPLHRTTDVLDLLECWDVYLTGGQDYWLYFLRRGSADTRAFVFQSPGDRFFATRADALAQGTTHVRFTTPYDDWYGVVVVNDNAVAGSYDVGILGAPVGVEEPAPRPERTALRSIQPNPTAGAMNIEYALAQAAPVSIRVLDMAGRAVSALADPPGEPGIWRVGWDGRGGDGRRLPPGIYFLRLEAAGKLVGQRKVTLLE